MLTSSPDNLLRIVEYLLLFAIIPAMMIARRIFFRVIHSYLPEQIKVRLNTPIYVLFWLLLVAFFYIPIIDLLWFLGSPVLALFQQHPLQDSFGNLTSHLTVGFAKKPGGFRRVLSPALRGAVSATLSLRD
jgi:hypothetical protein